MAKASKATAHYRPGTLTRYCAICTMFEPPKGCSSVEGHIRPQDLCDYFKRKPVPSKSASQARLMAAAAHTPGGYGGVPQSVGKEFNRADTGKKRSRLPERIGHLRKRGVISDKQHEKMEARR